MSDKEKIICSHCGNKYDVDFQYCPYCAEPKPVEEKEISSEQMVKSETNGSIFMALGIMLLSYIPCVIVVWVFNFFLMWGGSLNDKSITIKNMLGFKTILLISLIVDFGIGLITFVVEFFKTPREKIISYQFAQDQTSICPRCGSHNISLGRKGYDWNRGFWYRIFNIKGGHYLAGMNSRQIIAYCNNCGHKWETNKQWIK